MGFSRQEYWIGLPFPSPGDLPDPGIEPASPTLLGGFFTAEPPRKPKVLLLLLLIKRQVFLFLFLFLVVLSKNSGEGNGNPLQYSCLENPMDRGAWKAAVHGVAKSRT